MLLIEKLEEAKEEEGLSYEALAEKLDISKTHLYACLQKGRPMGREVLGAILEHYPQFGPYILEYIAFLRGNPNAEKRKRAAKVYRTRKKGPATHNPHGPGRKTKRVKNTGVTRQSRL